VVLIPRAVAVKVCPVSLPSHPWQPDTCPVSRNAARKALQVGTIRHQRLEFERPFPFPSRFSFFRY